ncbi:MAG: protein phosphatase 2C domain-containing protein [Elusimicrobia bacterium]|nr:protein phosphatase 2C domain-containing protein [Elusimicrobiota bacterium]
MRHLLAAGTTPGRLHLLAERPNQDACGLRQGPWGAVAVVCDGCGSEPGSGLGAALGASLTARAAARQLETTGSLDLAALGGEVLGGLCRIAETAGLDFRAHFLFTIVGAALAGETATVFACGDGVAVVDGNVTRLGPFPGNAPPYLAYGLEDGAVGLQRLYQGPAERVLVGTDGAADGELTPFWTEDRFLKNPDLLRRALKLQRLADDATAAVIRRLP